MSTNSNDGDLLRNPAVDFDRTDLSARGILLFLAGLLVAGIFIELVLWGMFRFLSHSTLFVQGNTSPMVQAQKAAPEKAPGARMQNTPPIDTQVFPEPRLQTNDVYDMDSLLRRENKILYPSQPFEDSTGTVHIPIDQAMALIVERGLPVKPSAPPRDFNAPMSTGARSRKAREWDAEKPAQPAALSNRFCKGAAGAVPMGQPSSSRKAAKGGSPVLQDGVDGSNRW